MIGILCGNVIDIQGNSVTIMIAGIGFSVCLAQPEQAILGKELRVYTYLHWHQENGPALFGFFTPFEKEVFMKALDCTGVGPKLALTILSELGASVFVAAILEQNDQTLSQVSGIGKKRVEQIIVHLKHKMAQLSTIQELPQSHIHTMRTEISQVLSSLNYSKQEIAAALNYLGEKNSSATFDAILRDALGFLAKKSVISKKRINV